MHHNLLLQDALDKLRGRHPEAMIVYADLFGPIMDMVESPSVAEGLGHFSAVMKVQTYVRSRLLVCSGTAST
uniref:Uncharacterized protein n=1 Tax=Aegilops tauschii subsp. strangulata TaxID=200361 RepID=A0A453EG98_AEGTS